MNTLPEAIAWTEARWHLQKPVPTRLHKRETEGVGLFYSPGFAAALAGNVNTIRSESRTVTCFHPLLRSSNVRDCRECLGTGVKEQRSDLYAFPMSLALRRLSAVRPNRKHPHPYALVVILASHGWNARQAAQSLDLPWERGEALFLMALRQLASFYEEGPVNTWTSAGSLPGSWIDLSDSQRSAIEAGETAA